MQPEKRISDVGMGLRMELDLSRLTDSLAYVFGAGENDVEAFFRCTAGDEPTVLDVGANIGSTTLMFSRLRPRAAVFAFEPSAGMRGALSRNIALNHLSNVQLVPLALGNANTTASLQADNAHNPGSAFVTGAVDAAGLEPINIVRLDDWLPPDMRIDFIKLDIEGYELRALQGAVQTLRRSWPDLIFELNEIALNRAGTSSDKLLAWVRGLGYHTRQVRAGRLEPYQPMRGLQNVGAIHPMRLRTENYQR